MSLRDMFNSYSSKDHPSRCLVTVEVWEVQQVGDTYIYEKSFLAVLHPMHLPHKLVLKKLCVQKGLKLKNQLLLPPPFCAKLN